MPVDLTSVVPLALYKGEDIDDEEATRALGNRALEYVRSFRWCIKVMSIYVGLSIAPVFGLFLVQIEASDASVDEWLWVVAGDVPPAYLVTDDCPTPEDALRAYIAEMDTWIRAIREQQSIDDLIPVTAPATFETANMLDSRLRFLERNLLS